jgi:hypothetical protein
MDNCQCPVATFFLSITDFEIEVFASGINICCIHFVRCDTRYHCPSVTSGSSQISIEYAIPVGLLAFYGFLSPNYLKEKVLPTVKDGGRYRTRTYDPLRVKQVL